MPLPIVLITRSQPSADRFARQLCAGLNGQVQPLIAPLWQSQAVEVTQDLSTAEGVVFTSQNAVRHLPARGLVRGMPAFCVGDATAEAARAAGFRTFSAAGTSEDLIALIAGHQPQGRLVYLRGADVSRQIVPPLAQHGVQIDEVIVYRQVPVPLPPGICAQIAHAPAVIAPVFSARSATRLVQVLPTTVAPILVSISAHVSAVLQELGYPASRISAEPTAQGLISAIAKVVDAVQPLEGDGEAL